MNSSRLTAEDYARGILEGDRIILARAITLIESARSDDQEVAGQLLDTVIARSGNSFRLGITGAPGVGKSTFIEAFGKIITNSGSRLAVLTIDPTSHITGGSILGDKTRMETLAKDPNAFIRPTPSGAAAGGVAASTREAILLCEAAGYNFIIVETVGTGQSEISVRGMVDFFLLLQQPGAGDELQGIKKGIVEMADAIAITKADGENLQLVKATQADFQQALHLLNPQPSGWVPKVVTCSSLTKEGLPELHELIQTYQRELTGSGYLQINRRRQQANWFEEHFHYLLARDPGRYAAVADARRNLTELVESNLLSPRKAANQLLDVYHRALKRP